MWHAKQLCQKGLRSLFAAILYTLTKEHCENLRNMAGIICCVGPAQQSCPQCLPRGADDGSVMRPYAGVMGLSSI